jgi:hypothetical protein
MPSEVPNGLATGESNESPASIKDIVEYLLPQAVAQSVLGVIKKNGQHRLDRAS